MCRVCAEDFVTLEAQISVISAIFFNPPITFAGWSTDWFMDFLLILSIPMPAEENHLILIYLVK